jgi:hypothetical protein
LAGLVGQRQGKIENFAKGWFRHDPILPRNGDMWSR